MKLEAQLRGPNDARTVSATGGDYEAAKPALQPLIDEDEQVLSYRRLED